MSKKEPKQVTEVRNAIPSLPQTISYSEMSVYNTCPYKWKAQYVDRIIPYTPNIYLVFGTAIHETIQEWLHVLYEDSVKAANNIDLHKIFYNKLTVTYKEEFNKNNKTHFSDSQEMEMFYLDGIHILDYLKKHRTKYFIRKRMYLVDDEVLLYYKIKEGLYFKGYLDLVFYNELLEEWVILDIKTSTKGWKSYAKKDMNKLAQLLLYKKFFSEQFKIPLDKVKISYFIVKRRIPKDAEYASMQRRVQEFNPPSGKIKIGQSLEMLNSFIENTRTSDNERKQVSQPTAPGKWTCAFCELKDNGLCTDSYYYTK